MILYIKQAGREIRFKGRIFRTPVKLNIQEHEIKKYENLMKMKSIRSYEFICENNHTIPNEIVGIATKKNRISVVSAKKKEDYMNIDNSYHDSIEDEIDIDINIDVDSDDILKQLLLNI